MNLQNFLKYLSKNQSLSIFTDMKDAISCILVGLVPLWHYDRSKETLKLQVFTGFLMRTFIIYRNQIWGGNMDIKKIPSHFSFPIFFSESHLQWKKGEIATEIWVCSMVLNRYKLKFILDAKIHFRFIPSTPKILIRSLKIEFQRLLSRSLLGFLDYISTTKSSLGLMQQSVFLFFRKFESVLTISKMNYLVPVSYWLLQQMW